jgi:hypothetical protein
MRSSGKHTSCSGNHLDGQTIWTDVADEQGMVYHPPRYSLAKGYDMDQSNDLRENEITLFYKELGLGDERARENLRRPLGQGHAAQAGRTVFVTRVTGGAEPSSGKGSRDA